MLRVSAFAALLAVVSPAFAESPSYVRTEDVVYGRKFGVALTLDVFAPKEKPNGLGLVFCVSGGWYSDRGMMGFARVDEFLRRGYTVFCVVHGSQPKFTIPEILSDMHRAVRFIKSKAKTYNVDPDRLGIYGGSAGGHLSLMQGTTGAAGDPKAGDPIDRLSSKVAAVACFFPPTDFLNYGKPGEIALGNGVLKDFRAPFDFTELDQKTRHFVLITDESKRQAIGKQISPLYHVTPDDAPSLIIHGDADLLVPIQQAELIVAALKKANVPAELVVRKGKVHGWPEMEKDYSILADWFDKHLAKKEHAAATKN